VLGLNENHNHDLKNIFKSAAISASTRPGPFQEFYAGLLAKGRRPAMARLTLARKIAAITLTIWKKGVCFDAGRELGPSSGVVVGSVLETLGSRGVSDSWSDPVCFGTESLFCTLCPLGEPEIAIGQEPRIEPWLPRN
jgi:hypothetical protein